MTQQLRRQSAAPIAGSPPTSSIDDMALFEENRAEPVMTREIGFHFASMHEEAFTGASVAIRRLSYHTLARLESMKMNIWKLVFVAYMRSRVAYCAALSRHHNIGHGPMAAPDVREDIKKMPANRVVVGGRAEAAER